MAPSAVAPEPYSRHLYTLKLYLDCETAPHALDLLGSGTDMSLQIFSTGAPEACKT